MFVKKNSNDDMRGEYKYRRSRDLKNTQFSLLFVPLHPNKHPHTPHKHTFKMVKAITSTAEFTELINSGKKVIVDYHATWCGYVLLL